MTCAKCHFCREFDKRDDAGFCKRYPPVYAQDEAGETMVTYPVVSSGDWCGEFRPRAND